MKKTKSMAAIAMAAAIMSTMMTTVVSADTTYYDSYSQTYYSAASNNINKIPNMIYMTNYTSGGAERLAKASASVTAAEGLLANIEYAALGLPAPAFTGISLGFAPTKYDYLIKANAENGATVLTFNSEANLKSAMTKIKTEEQTIMDNALLPYRNYIDNLISNGAYTRVANGDSADVKAAKLSNAALLSAAKNTLTYTYVDTDLFSGDVTGKTKTYQIAYLSEASIGNSCTQTVVSNDEEFTNFPRLIIDGQLLEWRNVHHLDLFNNSNNSWWFALKDGNTLNNDYYWLKGMMIPDFDETISFDAYAGNEWNQYGEASNSNNNNNTDDEDDTNSYYYNASYNYVSDNVYAVSDGRSVYYYPNIAYAKAAMTANKEWYITNVTKSTHDDYVRFFCFRNGLYYSTINESPYPENTYYMKDAYGTENTPSNTEMNYYFNDGNVYDKYGKLIGTAASRGYTSTNTWFCATDGRFYPTALTGKTGYYVSASNSSNTIDKNDPYYQYWMLRIEALMKELSNKNNTSNNTNNNSNNNNSSSNNSSSSNSNKNETTADNETTTSISASKLAALRASGDTIKIKPVPSATWTICGDNVTTPRDINLKITYNTSNIPSALKSAVLKDATSSVALTVGENLAWGTHASLTVKFKADRANFIAKLYRYNTATGTLELINTSTIGNSGYVTFNNINHGGEYFITLG